MRELSRSAHVTGACAAAAARRRLSRSAVAPRDRSRPQPEGQPRSTVFHRAEDVRPYIRTDQPRHRGTHDNRGERHVNRVNADEGQGRDDKMDFSSSALGARS